MKKIILSVLLMSTMIVFAGCVNQNSNQPNQPAQPNPPEQSGPAAMNFKEENSTDENGNPVITRTFNDGRVEKEIREGNKVIRINKHPNGNENKSIEETLSDGTRIMTHTDPSGNVHKMTEKDLGNGKRHIIIENKMQDGSVEVIDELHEEIDANTHKMTQKYQDGKIQEMLMIHNEKQDKNETTVTYPDGKVEKTIEEFIHQDDGSTKIITTKPDGTKEERINAPYRP